jgi:hypothetical protein
MGRGIATEGVAARQFNVDSLVNLFRELLIIASRKVGAVFVLKDRKDLFAGIPSRI